MNKVQKEVQQVFLDNEKETIKTLKEHYKSALDDINTNIEVLMARQDADMQHVIYQIEYQKALKAQIESSLNELHNNEFETLSGFLAKSYEDGFVGTMYDMQSQGVALVIPIDQNQVVDAIQKDTKLSDDLYTSLGKDIKTLKKQISSEISRGISTQLSSGEIARNISLYSDISQGRAMTIARTESHRIQCKATSDAQHRAKEKGANVVKQWDATLDGKTRDSHRMLDGQIRDIDEPFEIGGMSAMFPGDFGDPAEDCNCRCAILQRAKWSLEEDEAMTKWEDDGTQDGTQLVDISDSNNYEEFKNRYMKASN